METKYIIEEDQGIKLESFGGIAIFRPSRRSELELRIEAENSLRSKYATGIYTDGKKIDEILKYLFSFMHERLLKSIEKVSTLSFLKMILYQYDNSALINRKYYNHELNTKENNRWGKFGPTYRRALKYIAELIVIAHEPEKEYEEDEQEMLKYAEFVLINAEQIVEFYMLSDATFHIFPEDTILEIKPEVAPIGVDYYYNLKITKNNFNDDYDKRVVLDRENGTKYLKKNLLYERSEQGKYLNTAFLNEIGMNYEEAIKLIATIDNICVSMENDFDVPFINLKNLIKCLSENTEYPEDVCEAVVSGFLLTKEKMIESDRELFKPKQDYRALHRGFFEFPDETGKHIIWSRMMLKENLILLVQDIVFRQCPEEWNKGKIKDAIEKLSNASGQWFESIVEENLKNLGYNGKKNLKGLGKGTKYVKIPDEVGEIDYMGYSMEEKLLLIVECKLVRSTTEPKFFVNDIKDFVKSEKSYLKKFTAKKLWLCDNAENIVSALQDEIGIFVKPCGIAHVIITGFSSVATYFIEDTSCVSITEFCSEYERLGRYPFVEKIISV